MFTQFCTAARLGTRSAVFPILLLSVCAPPSLAADSTASRDRAVAYCDALAANARLAPLKDKVPFYTRNITTAHMAIRAKANATETKALLVLVDYYRKCQQAHQAVYRAYGDLRIYLSGHDAHLLRNDRAILAAARGEISLGRLNELRRESVAEWDAEVAATRDRIARERYERQRYARQQYEARKRAREREARRRVGEALRNIGRALGGGGSVDWCILVRVKYELGRSVCIYRCTYDEVYVEIPPGQMCKPRISRW